MQVASAAHPYGTVATVTSSWNGVVYRKLHPNPESAGGGSRKNCRVPRAPDVPSTRQALDAPASGAHRGPASGGRSVSHRQPGSSDHSEFSRRLAVRNDGPAIPPEALPTIFDPLVRGPKPETRRRPGSIGLGLHIAREIVTAHGGTIDVTSSAEAGTVFTVRLPRSRASR
jgi:hypothetical protein